MTNKTTQKLGPVFAVPSYTVKVRGEYGCAVLSRADLIQGQADCFLASRPGALVDVLYSEHCGHCSGAGRVRGNRRLLQWKPCPVCKGEPDVCADVLIDTIGGAA